MNRTVLMSSADYFGVDEAINPHYRSILVDRDRVRDEHQLIRHTLESIGTRVIEVEAPAASQDGVYVANWALVHDGKAVMAQLPTTRRAEQGHARRIMRELDFEIIDLPAGLKFSGQGDALIFGDRVFCGQGYRSDEQAQRLACEALGLERIQLKTVPHCDESGRPAINSVSGWADSFFYDIDLALAVVRQPSDDPGIIAYCPEAFDEPSQEILAGLDGVEKIRVSPGQARDHFACNLVSTGTDVLMSSTAGQLQAAIESYGLRTHTPRVVELAKGGGYIRCTSLALDG